MKRLLAEYKNKKNRIKKRLKEFAEIGRKWDDKRLFEELCFCILTPQSKAVYCAKAIERLKKSGILFNGNRHAVKKRLKKVRFPNRKAAYIVGARRFFKKNTFFDVRSRLHPEDIFKTREDLVKNVEGLGYKEASHFLRNIGMGKNLAILDIHILKGLKEYKVINKIPTSIDKKRYLDIEEKMRIFSRHINIPLEELDLLFWSKETGIIFK